MSNTFEAEPVYHGFDEVGGTNMKFIAGAMVFSLFAGIALSQLKDNLDPREWFRGGSSDQAPRGTLTYEGQKAETLSEKLMVEIGKGEATVSVKAKQNWDKSGTWLNGDFQSSNGTASVADPNNRELPAALKIQTRYCADGSVEKIQIIDKETGEKKVASIVFTMGNITVCDATLLHTPENDAAFKQDDTPQDFQGDFESFVANSAETVTKAGPCPKDDLELYSSTPTRNTIRLLLAEKYGLGESQVQVMPGIITKSDYATQAQLKNELENIANKRDGDNPAKTYPGLNVQFLQFNEAAVADSCYSDAGGTPINGLDLSADQLKGAGL